MSTAVQDAFDLGREAMRDVAGESAVYTPVGGTASNITLVAFIENYELLDPAGINVIGTTPAAQVSSVDVPTPKHGDSLVRSGVTYYLQRPEDDGLGITLLILSRKQ